MKRFYRDVTVEPADGAFRVALDGRPIRTQGGQPQAVPTPALADAMAEEWRAQGETIDPAAFPLRDLADFAIDHVRPDRAGAIGKLLRFVDGDTLCYRADPDEALYRRQQDVWEPLVTAVETRHGVRLERVSGVVHRPQPAASLERLRAVLGGYDDFTLSGLTTLASLAASLTIALETLETAGDPASLFAAANAEQDWQAELWGWDAEAQANRARRLADFETAARFTRLASAAASGPAVKN